MKRIVSSLVLFVLLTTTVLASSTKLNQTNQQINETKNELTQVKAEKNSVLTDINNLDRNINSTEAEIDRLEDQLKELENKITIAEENIKYSEEEYKRQDELLSKRLIARYESGPVSFWDVLFDSDNMSDFISRYYLLGEALEFDTQLLKDLQAQKEEIEKQKKDLEDAIALSENLKKESENKKLALSETKEKRTVYLSQLKESEEELNKSLDSLVAEANKLEDEIRKAQKGTSGTKYDGKMTWPLPGYYIITSPFGNRLHPVLKVYKLHTGVDIAGSGCNGANVVAADAGTVIKAEYNTGYGNYIIIDHGGGISTLYGHSSKLLVKKGDKVTKGQVIMKVGTTGYSTGPHLHFEVRENGKYVNPLDSAKGYLKR
jgi:murein DD-endopeptidase MepM/ murein hydrolase activator NlpD